MPLFDAMSTPAPIVAANRFELLQILEHVCQQPHVTDWNHIDVSKVDNFYGVFKGFQFVGDISRWDMSSAVSIGKRGQFNGDVSRWDVSNGLDFYEMFAGSPFAGDISGWRVSSGADIYDFMDHESFVLLPQPNMYVWSAALEDPSLVLKDVWRDHLKKHVFVCDALGLDVVSGAIEIQRQWQAKNHPRPVHETLELPSLAD